MGNPVDQNECYCTAGTCGAGMLDAAAAVAAAAVVQAAIGINPAAPEAGSPITFSAAQSTAASGRSIASYRWSVTDNGGIVTGFAGATDGVTAFITPSAAGRFTVDLTVTDSTGASSTVARSVDVAAVVVPATGDGGGGALGLGWLVALVVAVLALSRPGRQRPHG
jgi:serine protease